MLPLVLLGLLLPAVAQDGAPAQAQERPRPLPAGEAPPRSAPPDAPYSSSRETRSDIPPAPGTGHHRPGPGSTPPVGGVHELRPYNPHRAMKNVEVGEFYLKRKNYGAALSRFREALEHKPNDLHATYRLAETLEKMGDLEEALALYRAYLKILPEGGRFSRDSHRAVERVEGKLKEQAEQAAGGNARSS